MAEVQLQSIFRPYLRGLSYHEVEEKIKLKGAEIYGVLKKKEAGVLFLRDLLLWERPVQSALVLVCSSAAVWLISSFKASIILITVTVLIGISIADVYCKCSMPALPAGTRREAVTSDFSAGSESSTVGPMQHTSGYPALQQLSIQIAELWVYIGFYLTAAYNMRSQHPGAFCVLVSSACLTVACIGRLLTGTTVILVMLVTAMSWPCIAKYNLLAPVRRCLSSTGACPRSRLRQVAKDSPESTGISETSASQLQLASDTVDGMSGKVSTAGQVHVTTTSTSRYEADLCIDGQSLLPDIKEMPPHDIDEQPASDVGSSCTVDRDGEDDELGLPPDFLVGHFSHNVEINDTENALHTTSAERERFTHAEVDHDSVDLVTSALETAMASAASSIVTRADADAQLYTDDDINPFVDEHSQFSSSALHAAQQSPSAAAAAAAAVADACPDSDSDFEVLSVDEFDMHTDAVTD